MTTSENFQPTHQIDRRPVHPMLMPFPIVCFSGVLLSDVTYWLTAEMMWADVSAWLLVFGLITGLLAAIAGLFDFFSNRLTRRRTPAWPHLLGNLIALVLGFFNALVHSRDAWTSVVPTGLVLSLLTVLIRPMIGWLGRSIVNRQRVGVSR